MDSSRHRKVYIEDSLKILVKLVQLWKLKKKNDLFLILHYNILADYKIIKLLFKIIVIATGTLTIYKNIQTRYHFRSKCKRVCASKLAQSLHTP